MRDYLVVLILAPLLPYAIMAPQIGILLWCWVAFMHPHRLMYGVLAGKPLNMVVAIVTILGWLISKEKKALPKSPTAILLYLFMFWFSLTTYLAIGTSTRNYDLWDWSFKGMLLVILMMAIMKSKTRIQSVVWIIVLSLGYYGVKGGAFVIKSGGNYTVYGPDLTMIADNNQLSLALMMAIPLMYYLIAHSRRIEIKIVLLGSIFLTIVAIIGTYSRAGLIGLSIVLSYFWLRARMGMKVVSLIVALVLLPPAIKFMPDRWSDRMNTIETADQDASMMGRVDAWIFATNVALARPLVGGGFGVFYDPELWKIYAPGRIWRAPHSIYFEVLGSHGFVGLAIYLALAVVAWRNAAWITRRTKGKPEFAWARDLAIMIQVSFTGYFVAGASMNMAFYDAYYAMVGILAVLREQVGAQLTEMTPAAPKKRRQRIMLPVPAGGSADPQLSRRKASSTTDGTTVPPLAPPAALSP